MKVFALLALLLGACSAGASSAPATPSEPAAVESAPVASATPTPAVESSASPTDPSGSPAVTWGPLAVLPPQDGMDTAAVGGRVRIADGCVSLDAQDRAYLLVWHANQVTWNEKQQTITFENFPQNDDGKIVTVYDGDQVVLGGSGGGEDSGESIEAFISRMTWIAPPASSCSPDLWWSVGAVEK